MSNTKNTTKQNNKLIKILDVGSGYDSVAKQVFTWIENKEITRLDFDKEAKPDILHDITQPFPDELRNQFNIVYVSHILEHIEFTNVINTFRNVTGALKNMGEIWVVVPSMEWAANEIINQREGIHVQGAIYGGQNHPLDYHRSGFTLRSLRQMVEICGLIVRKAYQSPYQITYKDREYQCIQNVIVAMRVDTEENSPSEAIRVDDPDTPA